jgi:hypothetical protein
MTWKLVKTRERFPGEKCHKCDKRPERVVEYWEELPTRSVLRVLCEGCARKLGLIW